jgi:pimeloyl-ACP methyl ester carboxylesterase
MSATPQVAARAGVLPAQVQAPGLSAALERRGTRSELGEAWFIHGMLEDEHSWTELEQELDCALSVRPHFPWSAKFGSDWAVQQGGAEWIGAFADQRARMPRIVVCHSYGCNAMLEYLLREGQPQPEVLVLVSPFYQAARADVSWDVLTGLIAGLERLIGESIAAQDARKRYTGPLLADMVTRVRDRLGVYGWAEFLKLFLRSPDLPLHLLRSRTLVVSGKGDHYSRYERNLDLAAAIPGARHLCFDDGGHFVQKTHGGALARTIIEFSNHSSELTEAQ